LENTSSPKGRLILPLGNADMILLFQPKAGVNSQPLRDALIMSVHPQIPSPDAAVGPAGAA
jgi:hypothetical protein